MNDFEREIDEALVSEETIPREKVVSWIELSNEIRTLSKLYRLTCDRYYQIKPDLGGEITCGLIQRCLLRCIEEDITDDNEDIADKDKIKGRWDAAESLHIWFRQLLERGNSTEILATAARRVTQTFLSGSKQVRDAIEAGFLEHALETEGLRPYFEHWSRDSRLRGTWDRALAWGKAHPDFTWGLLRKIPRPKGMNHSG
jgi:hypothetical protein